MRGTMLIFRPSQQRAEVKHFDRPLALEDLKDGIGGGYAELVPGFRTIGYAGVVTDFCAFCDEDGKRKQLHINELANDAWGQALRRTGMGNAMGDYLVGQVAVVFGDREFMENL